MGLAVPRASMGVRSPRPLKSSVAGGSLLVNCHLEIQFHKKNGKKPLNKDYSATNIISNW